MYLAGAAGYGIYTTIFSHFMNDNMMSYGQQLTLTHLDMAHFNLGEYVGRDFLHSMMMVAMKQVYGYVIWFALGLAALFLLCDIPAVRTNIRKVPRWPVYAIEYLARRK
jgi:DHA2 family multidrug resistance protein